MQKSFFKLLLTLFGIAILLLAESTYASIDMQCDSLLLVGADGNNNASKFYEIQNSIQLLLTLENSFLTDQQFQTNSIYREQLLDKFKAEYNNLLNHGGAEAVAVFNQERLKLKASLNAEAQVRRRAKGERDTIIEEQKKRLGILNPVITKALSQPGEVLGLAASPDGQFLYVAVSGRFPKEGKIRIINLSEPSNIVESIDIPDGIRALTLSPDGQFLAVGTTLETRIIETATRITKYKIQSSGAVGSLAVSPDSKYLYTGNDAKIVREIELATGEVRKGFRTEGMVYALAVSPDGEYLYSGDKVEGLRATHRATWQRSWTIRPAAGVTSISVKPDSTKIYMASANEVRVWDLYKTTMSSIMLDSNINTMLITNDGKYLVTGAQNGDTTFIDLTSRNVLKIIKNEFPINALAQGPSKESLFTGSGSTSQARENKIRFLDLFDFESLSFE